MAMLSIWGILLVVLGHSGFEELIIQQQLSGLHVWIYNFHMPLFFLISGYLFSFTNVDFINISFESFVWKKVKRLLVPYFVIGTVIYLIKFAFSSLSHVSREFTFCNFLYMFVAPCTPNSTMGYLWYLITLFMVFLIVLAVSRLHIDLKMTSVCLLLILFLWVMDEFLPQMYLFNLSEVIHYTPFFLMGILFNMYEKTILPFIKRVGWSAPLILGVLSVILVYHPLPSLYGMYRIVASIVGILFSISLCTLLLQYEQLTVWLLPYARYTYSIYILSWFGQYIAKIICINMLGVHWFLCVVSMFISGIIVPLMIVWCVDHCRGFDCKPVRMIIGC